MASNRGVVYVGPGKVEVQSIDYPELKTPDGRPIQHGAIVKPVATNICASDQHMVRGRTSAPAGMVLGHEITGEVIECGRDVERVKIGDLVSVPFNVACGRCRNCKERRTDVCLNVGTGIKTTIRELVDELLATTGSDLVPEYRQEEQMFVTHRVGSTELAEQLTGFRSEIDYSEGLRSVVDWRRTDQGRAVEQEA